MSRAQSRTSWGAPLVAHVLLAEQPHALTFASWLAIDSGEDLRALELAERLASLADAEQLGFVQPMGTILRGWAIATDRKAEEGIALILDGLDVYRRSGQPLYLPWSLRLLANLCIRDGRLEAARAALVEGLEIIEATEQRVLVAELHRLIGELVLAEGGEHRQAQAHFAHALEVASSQGAIALERHAAASLERLAPVG